MPWHQAPPYGTWIMSTWFIYDLRKLFLIHKKNADVTSKLVCMTWCDRCGEHWHECDWHALECTNVQVKLFKFNHWTNQISRVHLSMRCWLHPRTDGRTDRYSRDTRVARIIWFCATDSIYMCVVCRVYGMHAIRDNKVVKNNKTRWTLLLVPCWFRIDTMGHLQSVIKFLGTQRYRNK